MSADVTPELQELAAAIRDALDLPIPATSEGWTARERIVCDRAAYLCGALGALAGGGDDSASPTIASVRSAAEFFPATYEAKDGAR